MAFVKKTWKDRIAEFPTRRRLTKSNGDSELVTVAREEGTLSQEGDAFSAENMNDLESRVDNAISEINSNLTALSNYSITETKIGTWVDGKPIYRRIYTADNVNISSSSIIDSLFTSSNISTLIGIKCCTYVSSEWNENLCIVTDKTYSAYARVDTGGVRMVVTNSNISKYAIIIEYTKN